MASSDTSPTKAPLIVYVDDEQSNLDTFRFNFGSLFSLKVALGPEEALECVRNHDIAVMITDFRMPRTNGLELLEQVREVQSAWLE